MENDIAARTVTAGGWESWFVLNQPVADPERGGDSPYVGVLAPGHPNPWATSLHCQLFLFGIEWEMVLISNMQ